jgi:Common central domain of tyrosinase
MTNGQTLTRYDITDLNNGNVPGFPVADPPGWDELSFYYAKALQNMGWNPSGEGSAPAADPSSPFDAPKGTPNVENTWDYSESPESYFFWGAMHWWPGHDWELWNDLAPAPQSEYWSHCTHGPAQVEKYFLPWHRAYIYYYEVIIRSKVAELGGPDSWAIPYWNYSFYDPDDLGPWPRSSLPWVFCQQTLPDDSPNPLYLDVTRRGLQPTWADGEPMRLQDSTPFYAGAYGQTSFEPAGAANGFNATLDGRPHGAVHNDTGNGDGVMSLTGWMQFTQTAGFDPIFWLHHSEIDRFWVGWNAAGGADPGSSDPDWATASDDDIKERWNFWANGNINDVIVVHPGDMLDPANLDPGKFPYSYGYQDLPTVPAPRQAGRQAVAAAVPQLATPAAPVEGVAADAERKVAEHDEKVEVGHQPVTTEIALSPEAPQLLAALDTPDTGEAGRTVLRLDGIVAYGPTGNYEVYLNNPGADRDTHGSVPHFVGLFSSFGANHAHGGGEPHGLSASYDITDLVAYLRANGEWDESKVQVTFVPVLRTDKGNPVTAPVTIGSIQIITE